MSLKTWHRTTTLSATTDLVNPVIVPRPNAPRREIKPVTFRMACVPREVIDFNSSGVPRRSLDLASIRLSNLLEKAVFSAVEVEFAEPPDRRLGWSDGVRVAAAARFVPGCFHTAFRVTHK